MLIESIYCNWSGGSAIGSLGADTGKLQRTNISSSILIPIRHPPHNLQPRLHPKLQPNANDKIQRRQRLRLQLPIQQLHGPLQRLHPRHRRLLVLRNNRRRQRRPLLRPNIQPLARHLSQRRHPRAHPSPVPRRRTVLRHHD